MRTLQKTAILFGVAGGLVFVAFAISAALRSGQVDEEAREVEAIVERDYRHPERHTLTRAVERDEEPLFIEWARRYDGIDVAMQVISLGEGSGRQVRWHRELAEPEPVRRDDLLSFAQAAASAGLREAFERGEVKARLLYRPKLTLPASSTDGELVVESFQLVIELDVDGRTAYVDAYTGTLIKRLRPSEPT